MYSGAAIAVLVAACGAAALAQGGAPAAGGAAPRYAVNPMWPQPLANLPNHWVLGPVSGVAVDSQDHVWIVHRGAEGLEANERGLMANPPTSSMCCVAAPAVLEFNQQGMYVSGFGGKETMGFTNWPQSTGGIAVDSKGNVWVTAYGLDPAPAGGRGRGAAAADPDAAPAPARGARGGAAGGGAAAGGAAAGGATPRGGAPAAAAAQAPAARGGRGAAPAAAPVAADAHVTKYSRSGVFELEIGKAGQAGTPDSQTLLNRPAGVGLDEAANEVYIADSGNHRIVVFDMNTGAFKRMWGGSGEKPTAEGAGRYDPSAPPSKQFRDPFCVKISKDGMVYVCDRSSDRIQVFQKNGTFVKEMVIAKETTGATAAIGSLPLNSSGSVWDIAFSNDAGQRYLFVADGHNNRIRILRRDTLAEVGTIGDGGRQPGRFLAPGSVAVDSRGNLYTGEQHHAKRVQKFQPAAAAAPAAPAGAAPAAPAPGN
jgi:DNA-binding beta-propeller fold protein YncE